MEEKTRINDKPVHEVLAIAELEHCAFIGLAT